MWKANVDVSANQHMGDTVACVVSQSLHNLYINIQLITNISVPQDPRCDASITLPPSWKLLRRGMFVTTEIHNSELFGQVQRANTLF